jgi:GntP family permease
MFGKLMDDSGSVEIIARFMTEKLGTERAVLAITLAGAIVTYGGVSLFVPSSFSFPWRRACSGRQTFRTGSCPAAIALGTMTFTMSALPVTPCSAKRDSDAVLQDHTIRRSWAWDYRRRGHARLRALVAQPRRSRRESSSSRS